MIVPLILISWQVMYDANDKVVGIRTNDMGIAKDGSKRETFQAGVDLKGMDSQHLFFPLYWKF